MRQPRLAYIDRSHRHDRARLAAAANNTDVARRGLPLKSFVDEVAEGVG